MRLSGSLPVSSPAFAAEARPLLRALPRRPGLVVIGGHPESSRLSHYFIAGPLLRGETVLFLDAANCFSPHQLALFARRCRRPEGELLRRVLVSRAFTCFQLAELIERTRVAARRTCARLAVLTGMPDIFDDEEIAAEEAQRVFRHCLEEMRRWLPCGLTALVFSDADPAARPLRPQLAQQLARHATGVYRLAESPAGLHLHATKTFLTHTREKAGPSSRKAGLGMTDSPYPTGLSRLRSPRAQTRGRFFSVSSAALR